jgi:acetyltransferase-like isoleucine patch superfamily enzyme
MQALIYLERAVPLLGALFNRIRFPGLWTGLRVEIVSSGRFNYGKGIRLGEGTRIDLLPGSVLEIDDGVIVGRNAHFSVGAGGHLRIGAGTAVQDMCRFLGDVAIGKGCIFAPNVFISTGTHTFDALPHLTIQEQERAAPARIRPIRLFDDCWLGINVVVTPGVTIGRGCVVGANSVVTQDLPPYSVAAGNPARVIRSRLAFVPKPRIDASCPEDAPYFYDGFDPMRASERAAQVAGKEFILALTQSNGRQIRLNLSAEGGEIQHQDQRLPMPRKEAPETLTFELRPGACTSPLLTFRVDAPCRLHWAEVS